MRDGGRWYLDRKLPNLQFNYGAILKFVLGIPVSCRDVRLIHGVAWNNIATNAINDSTRWSVLFYFHN